MKATTCRVCAALFALMSAFAAAAQNQSIASINSDQIEYAPSISANGRTLIFQSNKDGSYKLYAAHLSAANEWSAPESIDAVNNFGESSDLIGGPSISYDGNFIYFFATFKGGLGQEDIWYTERTGGGWGTPVNMGANVNTPGYDGFPSISSDGKSLYFMRLTEKLVNKYNCYSLLVSEKGADGVWGKPKVLPKPINVNCEKCPRIMPDNETLLFASIREGSIDGSFDMYETKLLPGNKWSAPKPLAFLNTENNEYFGSVSAEGDLMYFNAKGTRNEDILVATIPEELRPSRVFTIEGQTLSASDGKPLQASVSAWQGNKKIADLPSNASDGSFTLVLKEGEYQLRFYKEGFRQKSATMTVNAGKDDMQVKLPVLQTNLQIVAKNALTNQPLSPEVGVKVESGEKPAVKLVDGKAEVSPLVYGGSYEVTVASKGFEAQKLSIKLSAADSTAIVKEVALKPLPPQLSVVVIDSETKKAMPAQVRVMDMINKKYLYNGTLTDTLKTALVPKGVYRVIANASDHLFDEEVVDLVKEADRTKFDLLIEMIPIRVGAKLQLKEIFFETNSAEITPDSYPELKEVFDFLAGNKNLVIEISAHTDDVGDHFSNVDLSDKRANAVVNFLIGRGVPPAMLVAKGYGESEPSVPNNSAENRQKNRRVEFKVLEKR